jgi:hypothetical protein
MAMDGRLACQTDETTDARETYGVQLGDCDDCQVALAARGTALPLAFEDDAGELTSLARAVLAGGQRADARSIAPGEAAQRTRRPA